MDGQTRVLRAVDVRGDMPLGVAGVVNDDSRRLDRGAVAQALGSVDLERCARGVAGVGRVAVTLMPSGTVSSVAILEFNGNRDLGTLRASSTGRCVLREYSKVVVPPFTGDQVTLGAHFTIRALPSPQPRAK